MHTLRGRGARSALPVHALEAEKHGGTAREMKRGVNHSTSITTRGRWFETGRGDKQRACVRDLNNKGGDELLVKLFNAS